jgi:hypothetical protein
MQESLDRVRATAGVLASEAEMAAWNSFKDACPSACAHEFYCSICQCQFALGNAVPGGEVELPGCKHRFCGSCIGEWLAMAKKCPHCRSVITFCDPAEEVGVGEEEDDEDVVITLRDVDWVWVSPASAEASVIAGVGAAGDALRAYKRAAANLHDLLCRDQRFGPAFAANTMLDNLPFGPALNAAGERLRLKAEPPRAGESGPRSSLGSAVCRRECVRRFTCSFQADDVGDDSEPEDDDDGAVRDDLGEAGLGGCQQLQDEDAGVGMEFYPCVRLEHKLALLGFVSVTHTSFYSLPLSLSLSHR